MEAMEAMEEIEMDMSPTQTHHPSLPLSLLLLLPREVHLEIVALLPWQSIKALRLSCPYFADLLAPTSLMTSISATPSSYSDILLVQHRRCVEDLYYEELELHIRRERIKWARGQRDNSPPSIWAQVSITSCSRDSDFTSTSSSNPRFPAITAAAASDRPADDGNDLETDWSEYENYTPAFTTPTAIAAGHDHSNNGFGSGFGSFSGPYHPDPDINAEIQGRRERCSSFPLLPCYHCLQWLPAATDDSLSSCAFSRIRCTKAYDIAGYKCRNRVCISCGIRSGFYERGTRVKNCCVCVCCGKLGERQDAHADGGGFESRRKWVESWQWKVPKPNWRDYKYCAECKEKSVAALTVPQAGPSMQSSASRHGEGKGKGTASRTNAGADADADAGDVHRFPRTMQHYVHEARWGKYERSMREGKKRREENGRRIRLERGVEEIRDRGQSRSQNGQPPTGRVLEQTSLDLDEGDGSQDGGEAALHLPERIEPDIETDEISAMQLCWEEGSENQWRNSQAAMSETATATTEKKETEEKRKRRRRRRKGSGDEKGNLKFCPIMNRMGLCNCWKGPNHQWYGWLASTPYAHVISRT